MTEGWRVRDTQEQTLRRSDSTLKRRACMLCGQSLYKAKRGHCGAIWFQAECYWVPLFAKAKAQARSCPNR